MLPLRNIRCGTFVAEHLFRKCIQCGTLGSTIVRTMEIADRIRRHGGDLTPAERRVAEAILSGPNNVAFGTVSDLAQTAGAGAATVVRLAAKLGFEGYSELQASVRDDLTSRLRPAAERIREQAGDRAIDQYRDIELANVRSTLDGLDGRAIDELVGRLADLEHPVAVISGDASTGVAVQFTADLGLLRPGVELLTGNNIAIQRQIALLAGHTTVIALDVRRYDRWLVDAVRSLHTRGCWIAAVTDSPLSPIALDAVRSFFVHADSDGPFDSHVGTLALLNAVVATTAGRLTLTATDRLDGVERAWRDGGSLTDR
jgi:DNA-binding MurR/RpiR family transcriptional regulator